MLIVVIVEMVPEGVGGGGMVVLVGVGVFLFLYALSQYSVRIVYVV